ncbi:hypothetical protein V7S43_013792 [Phytophthora oleae]|uniref:Uncharacterized protein n=1 Tax=Phytophthora oleae TaxID=2107226 RepID=A0ABD3F473_9STRA
MHSDVIVAAVQASTDTDDGDVPSPDEDESDAASQRAVIGSTQTHYVAYTCARV